MNAPSLALALAFSAAALAASAVAQAPAQEPTKPAAGAGDKLTDWPALKDTDKERVRSLVGQFRKPDVQLQEDAVKQLIALGAGAAPLLMQQVSDRPENSNARIFQVLDQMLTAKHAGVMARETKRQQIELRRYLTHRLCRFPDPDLVGAFDVLQKDKDAATAFYAQVGLLARKRLDVLPAVMAYTKTRFPEVAATLAEALPPARSAEVGTAVFEAIAKAGAVEQMTGLRLLRHLMVKEQKGLLRAYLEASEHTVKREAVNTARVLHGEPPIDDLSVFQAIEHAKQWLQKV